MHRDRGAATGETMNMTGIGQLVPEIDGRRVLEKLPEPRAGVGKAPRRRFDCEGIERLTGAAELGRRHGGL